MGVPLVQIADAREKPPALEGQAVRQGRGLDIGLLDAGRALAEAASRITDRDPRPLTLVTGMFARKDAEGFFRPFAEMRPRVICTSFDSPIAAPAEELVAAAVKAGLSPETAANVADGVARALETDGPAPHVLICGGLHFAGEVLAMSRDTWPT